MIIHKLENIQLKKALQYSIANFNMKYTLLWRELYEFEDLNMIQLHKFDVLWVLHKDNYILSKEIFPEIFDK